MTGRDPYHVKVVRLAKSTISNVMDGIRSRSARSAYTLLVSAADTSWLGALPCRHGSGVDEDDGRECEICQGDGCGESETMSNKGLFGFKRGKHVAYSCKSWHV